MANCLFSTNVLNFGVYDVFSVMPNDSISNIQIICQDQIATVALSVDKGLYGSIQSRIMQSDQNSLNYNVYWDSARTILAGDGVNGQTFSTHVDHSAINIPLYGRIPPNQDVSIGTYIDKLTVTINF